MPVTGIGGLFFRAKNPEALSLWYRTHFGIGLEPDGVWNQSSGPTVFMPFPADTDYFAPNKQWMINLRVDDLDALLQTLRASGIEITMNPEWNTPETGRFARVHDPEGNAVEIWEPPHTSAPGPKMRFRAPDYRAAEQAILKNVRAVEPLASINRRASTIYM